MPIIGGRITRMEAKKKEENTIEGFDMNFGLENATADKTVLNIKYTCKIDYKPDIAEITVEGELFYQDEEKKVKALAEEFKKTRKLPNDIIEEVLSGMNYSSQTVGTLAAFALNITAPINVPKTKLVAPPAGSAPQPGQVPAPKGQAG